MRRVLACLCVLSIGGCESLGYYAQSARGQIGVMAASRPVEEVLDDPRTVASVRARLTHLDALRRFAVNELGLADSDSYTLYADLHREAMVWSVIATPVDSLVPREWCYPVVGCAGYRGYFSEERARDYAERLTGEGWDVAVEPVPAYSTLGWFSDPLPSTVAHWPIADIAALVFHERAHETLYLPGDSAFNEGYASMVEREGVRRWLASSAGPDERAERRAVDRRRAQFLQLLAGARARLESLYATGPGTGELIGQKQEIFDALRDDYAGLKDTWDGYRGYDRWFDRPLNNAHLAGVYTYNALEPAFRQILRQADGDMRAFHAACRQLAALDAAVRRERMAQLAAAHRAPL